MKRKRLTANQRSDTRICEMCGGEYHRPSYQRQGRFARRQYCSWACARAPKTTLAERYLNYVMPEPNSGCWLWTGAATQKGYGHIAKTSGGGFVLAHRLSYEMYRGPIPDGLLVLHKCDTPLCSNPDHLYLGTAYDNAQDRWRKGSY